MLRFRKRMDIQSPVIPSPPTEIDQWKRQVDLLWEAYHNADDKDCRQEFKAKAMIIARRHSVQFDIEMEEVKT